MSKVYNQPGDSHSLQGKENSDAYDYAI
jgi:hypothetical protein